MNTYTLFQAFLTVHLIGFALFVGTTLADFFFFRRFWLLYDRESSAVKIAAASVARFPAIMRFGILLAIVAGVGMMALTNGVFGEQVWMRIKIPLVIAALLNTLIIRRRQGSKLNISLDGRPKNALTRDP